MAELNAPAMPRAHPDRDTLRSVLASAVRAPSVHNTQPWLWRTDDSTVHLYADESRWLPHTDPEGRDLLLSCGAALHHLRVAARGLGWETVIHRLPDPAEPRHLAVVEFRAATATATPEAIRMAAAIHRRHTDRRRYAARSVPVAYVEAVAAGAGNGVHARCIDAGPARTQLLRAFEQAAWEHTRDFSYGLELAQWSGRQGAPGRHAVLLAADAAVRPFSNPGLPQTVIGDVDAADRLILLSTPGDDRLSRLRAGEAASAVLLTATTLGLATCPLTEPLELTDTRNRIRTNVLGDSGYPHIVVRIGWAEEGAGPVPATARRPLDEVLHPLDAAVPDAGARKG
ncbi:Acg family FMN-binding oxidoreductase [Nocardia pneumoniae]|uniref:Acg family FMN-binding oxidoreductase n=1 Tax=Nocardia pneumoniae TaxID=228601 RepID=UPI00030DC8B6|nr:NAD(P)H nitroreductase [Nocardia pneumoniae]